MNLPIEPISDREMEVLKLLCQGYSNQQSASALFISVKTIEKHRAMLNYKLATNNILSLLRAAMRLRLFTLDEFYASRAGENIKHPKPATGFMKTRNHVATHFIPPLQHQPKTP